VQQLLEAYEAAHGGNMPKLASLDPSNIPPADPCAGGMTEFAGGSPCANFDPPYTLADVWAHVQFGASFCLGVITCFNFSLQGSTLGVSQTAGLSTGGAGIPEPAQVANDAGKTHSVRDFTGISVNWVTATPWQQGLQVFSAVGAQGPIGGNFAVGERKDGEGLYYSVGWSGGTGYALQGPPLWSLEMTLGSNQLLQGSALTGN
jgi:hypothetical protein